MRVRFPCLSAFLGLGRCSSARIILPGCGSCMKECLHHEVTSLPSLRCEVKSLCNVDQNGRLISPRVHIRLTVRSLACILLPRYRRANAVLAHRSKPCAFGVTYPNWQSAGTDADYCQRAYIRSWQLPSMISGAPRCVPAECWRGTLTVVGMHVCALGSCPQSPEYR